MMNELLKHISVFPLLLAGLILGAHQLIPHDHHIADSYSNQDKDCPASDNQSNHNSGFPVHCHAFNDLVSEKSRINNILPYLQYDLNPIICPSGETNVDLQVSCVIIIDLQKPLFDSHALELFLLRAPPSRV